MSSTSLHSVGLQPLTRFKAMGQAVGALVIASGLFALSEPGLYAGAQTKTTDAGTNSPVAISADENWIPLQPSLEIEPGSALDFSRLGLNDPPAGKQGRVIARADGQFAFADSPNEPRRFYGVNFCFGALYLNHEEADRVAERLARLGYNALRIHHYENELVSGQPKTTMLNPQKAEQFDYFMAALIRRGIYLTTDLFVSRSIPYREIGIERDDNIPMDTFKILVPVHAGAFENWKQFTGALLTHTNAYTHRTYAEEPALAWIAMLNEGNFGNFFRDMRGIPEWKRAWNEWLGKRYGTRQALAAAWGDNLKEDENPAAQTVALPERLQAEGLRSRDCIAFLAATEREMVLKMRAFLREELGCRALISNSSSWTRFTTDQGARTVYDYVDDHFYVDHPQFLEQPWHLPSRCPNTSPIKEGAPGGRGITFTRLFDKPFTVTEYNYSGPGRFRGVGGILTGAMGALQGWGGIWRFAYSHSRQSLNGSQMGYFDVASDPLSQAADRASLCLFLRGDLQTAPGSVALVMTEADLAHPASRIPTLAPPWHWLAWVTRVGTQVVPSPKTRLPESVILPLGWQTPASEYDRGQVLGLGPYTVKNEELIAGLQPYKLFSPAAVPNPSEKFFRSQTGEITIDGPQGRLLLDTPRTAGGYASAGQTIEAGKGTVRITIEGSDATVWVSSLDLKPVTQSRRLLVTHLTDLQNTDIKYAEPARQTLVAWGRLPYLVRAGKAQISLGVESPKKHRVWALGTNGKRLHEVRAETSGSALQFTADVAGGREAGAQMLYEVVLGN